METKSKQWKRDRASGAAGNPGECAEDREMKQNRFYKNMWSIALPVTLQSLLQSSFSMIDQVMIGQLGEASIAGIGLGGKFASMYSVVLGAIAAAAGIMIAQYVGQENDRQLQKGFSVNLVAALVLAAVFTMLGVCIPKNLLGLYTTDQATIGCGAEYLRIYAAAFVPMAGISLLSVLLRCLDAAVLPLVVSFAAVGCNTGLNYLLIFGKCGFSAMGVAGAAVASVASQAAAMLLMIVLTVRIMKKQGRSLHFDIVLDQAHRRQYAGILLPILVCEFLWSLGENIYAGIYGHMGTDACAAMTMTGCVQGLVIGALSGVSQAAGIMIGKQLGNRDEAGAYRDAKRFMGCGVIGSLILSAALILVAPVYVRIYQVEPQVRELTRQILIAFAVIAPVKVQNMILGGGIIRSGGKTKYVMCIDFIGTWLFGVPLGLLAAFVWKLPVPWVYFILSLEEVVRLVISLVLFCKKVWMEQL